MTPDERSSQAHNASGGQPTLARWALMRSNPCASESTREKRTRTMAWPGSATTAAEYWKPPGR